MALLLLSIIGMQAQGTFGLKNGDAGVASGTTETSVENITMTWGVTGGANFKGGNKKNDALTDVLGATAYCEGNGVNGSLTEGVYAGTVYLFTPAINGKLTVGIVLNNGKAFYVKEGTDGTDVDFTLTKADGTAVTLDADRKAAEKLTGGLVTFAVEAGKTYAVYCTGSKLGYYGFKFEKTEGPASAILFDFEHNNGNWPVGEGADFALGNVDKLTVDGVTLTGIQGESMNPVRIMNNASRGICLWIYKNTALKFNAPEGKAITKIEVTMQTGSFDLAPSTGTLTDNVWTGNATEVTFGPNANSTRYVWAFAVTLADENAETVKPAAFDAEAANIAAFNAIEDGKTVKLTLKDARVNAYWDMQGAYYVEDASGATVVKGVTLKAGQALNGYIVGKKSTNDQIDYTNDPAVAVEYTLTASDASTFGAADTELKGTEMSITDACAQAVYGKLVTLKDVTISGTGQNKTLTDAAGNTMKARDYLGVLPAGFVWPEKASTFTGVIIYYMTGWFILPISAEAIVEAAAEPATTTATFNFADPNFRENIGEAMTDTKGYIYNETFTAENVTLQITGGSAPSRIYVDANRGQNLVTYTQYATLTFRAPEGKAITKIEFTAAGSSNINKFTVSSGAIEGMAWTGNAEGVRFTQGGTSYLANAIVTLVSKTAETTALPAIEYAECANIAAFNALEAGTYAKITLKDAEVIGKSADGYSTVWVQDATGGCWIQYTSLNDKLQEKTKINGTIYAIKRVASGNPQIKEAEDTPKSELATEAIESYTMIEGNTIAEVNVAANLNKVIKLTGASFVATSTTVGTLTLGEETISLNNGNATANQQLHKIEPWVKDETKMENVTIVAILSAKSTTENQLLPISMVEEEVVGISNVNAAEKDVTIYNLQGVRMNKLQKGMNIINGKKIVVKQ